MTNNETKYDTQYIKQLLRDILQTNTAYINLPYMVYIQQHQMKNYIYNWTASAYTSHTQLINRKDPIETLFGLADCLNDIYNCLITTHTININKHNSITTLPDLLQNNNIIIRTESTQYLGLICTNKLNFEIHLQHIYNILTIITIFDIQVIVSSFY